MTHLLEGKVALVTGAGGGLGRAYALALAEAGAQVLVNDLGGARDGSGQSASMADEVVALIQAGGGQAAANHDSVADPEGAQRMVDQALERFGRLDIVINNAGILRDKTLLRMSDAMWEQVVQIHMTGTFLVTRAALAVMVRQDQGGRIINTTSYAGLKGNFGQANYAAAKAGIAGFTRTVALEARKAGVMVNAVAPIAKTRMTEDIAMVPDQYSPADIAPLVVWLASPLAEGVTGRIFGAHGSHYLEYLTEMTQGVDLGQARWTPELVQARLEEISMSEAARARLAGAGSAGESDGVRALLAALPGTLRADKVGAWRATVNLVVKGSGQWSVQVQDGQATFHDAASSSPTGTVTFDSAQTLLGLIEGRLNAQQAFMQQKITTDDMGVLMSFAKSFDLEALKRPEAKADAQAQAQAQTQAQAAGVNRAAIGKKYKGHAQHITPALAQQYAEATNDPNPRYQRQAPDQLAPPMYAVRPMIDELFAAIQDPELGADVLRLVHGEQEMIFHQPLRAWDLVAPRAQIVGVEDKSSGQIVHLEQRLMRDGELVTQARSALFIRAKTRHEPSGSKPSAAAPSAPPERGELIAQRTHQVAADQSHRYAAISNDRNPIHVDPEVARAAGLPEVILHGLCTMAMAASAVVDETCQGDPTRLKRLKVRFARPVFNGDTLTTRIWRQGDALTLETVNQRDEVVLSHGEADVV